MRIWYQSSSAIGENPVWESYERALKKHVQKVARPGTTVDVHGVKTMAQAIERVSYFEFLNNANILDNAIRAEREGYDAYAFGGMYDSGAAELKQILTIPCAFPSESAFHVVSMLAPKFALLSHNVFLYQRVTENCRRSGLNERLVPSGYFDMTLTEIREGFDDPDIVMKEVQKVAKIARDNGADMLISCCNCLTILLVEKGIKEIEGLPVFDNVGNVIKVAELMVDLKGMGIDRSRRGLYAPVTREELTSVRKLYKVE